MTEYGAVSRLLHRIALGPAALREAVFDLDQRLGGPVDVAALSAAPPVFVTGLARSGTSVLLRTLYGRGTFSTLTYRHMPFVLAPRLWRRVSERFGKVAPMRERAHGDGLGVDFDSPEAFEEVFWLTFSDQRYVMTDRLVPHSAGAETIDRFRRYVAAISGAPADGQNANRYLSKNNNNLLRLASLRRAFPAAAILVPFRKPEEQAASLCRQHHRFRKRHHADPFGRDYMRWLGHFEFGADHRPLDLSDAPSRLHGLDSDRLDYWLAYWTAVYEAVRDQVGQNGLQLVDFDALCSRPRHVLESLFETIHLDADAAVAAKTISAPKSHRAEYDADTAMLRRAKNLHAELVDCASECPRK